MDGELVKVALCKECARRGGFFDPKQLKTMSSLIPKELSGKLEEIIRELIGQDDVLAELMGSTMKGDEGRGERVRGKSRNSVCPNCGYTWAKYKETHRLGCSMCYEQFEKQLNRVFFPNRWNEEKEENEEVNDRMLKEYLEGELKEAVKDERYEKAAHLRDCIQQLREDV